MCKTFAHMCTREDEMNREAECRWARNILDRLCLVFVYRVRMDKKDHAGRPAWSVLFFFGVVLGKLLPRDCPNEAALVPLPRFSLAISVYGAHLICVEAACEETHLVR